MAKPCFRSKGKPCTCKRLYKNRKEFSNQSLIDIALWASDGMFGDIIFDAQEELRHRRKMPEWAVGKSPWNEV